MTRIDPKEEFGKDHVELRIKPYMDAEGNISHKHIYAVRTDKHYIKDREHNWYRVEENECGLCEQ